MGNLSKLLLVIAGISLVIAIFIPIWRIELSAPQYPEGLVMLIYADKLGGDVDIINGLNHYIGMQTLHAENFIEFTVLRYIIGFFAMFCFVVALAGRKNLLYILLAAFITFGVVAMIDFYRWEYNYGHDLDPNAAIIVPGMAYQPPLIGYKVLLNFGAYSIPDVGGWLFIASGVLMLICVVLEKGLLSKFLKQKTTQAGILILSASLMSCSIDGPEPIKLNSDNCDQCKMTITDGRFGAELITGKGRIYKFDDFLCLQSYIKSNPNVKSVFINNYLKTNELIPAKIAWFVNSENFRSPMGGNTGAFASEKEAKEFAALSGAKVQNWLSIKP